MRQYPISVPRDVYRGTNAARKRKQWNFNDTAKEVENYLNAEMAKEPDDTVRSFLTVDIARRLNLDPDVAHRIIFPIDGGHNGVTICKGDRETALLKARGE